MKKKILQSAQFLCLSIASFLTMQWYDWKLLVITCLFILGVGFAVYNHIIND